MLREDKLFWEKVAACLEVCQIFDKDLRTLLGKRVDEFYSKSDKLKETDRLIRCYCEAIGTVMALKKAVEETIKTDSKEISAKVFIQEEWPDVIWKEWTAYCSCNGIVYEVDKKESKIFLFRDEECAGLIGDEYDYFDEVGNLVIDGVVYSEQ